jgi:hypothetical protein
MWLPPQLLVHHPDLNRDRLSLIFSGPNCRDAFRGLEVLCLDLAELKLVPSVPCDTSAKACFVLRYCKYGFLFQDALDPRTRIMGGLTELEKVRVEGKQRR